MTSRILAGIAFALLPAALPAQSLTVGTWNGTLAIGGTLVPVAFTVHPGQAQDPASMQTSDGPDTPVSEMVVSGDRVGFRWGAFVCVMELDGGAFAGECLASDGTRGAITLSAPLAHDTDDGPRNSDILTGQELVESGASDLYEAVRRLRPRWLQRQRGGTTSFSIDGVPVIRGTVTVYLGRQAYGSAAALRQFSPEHVAHLRFYGPRDAIVKFGSKNQGGVIEIVQR